MSQERERDGRIVIVNSGVNIRKMLEENGYPFKSKEFSLRVNQFNKGSNANFVHKYLTGWDMNNGKKSKFVCPKCLKYIFEEKGKYNYSNKCCYKLKKDTIHKWEKETKKTIAITGMRAEEGGTRVRLGCTIFKGNKLYHFHPLIVVSEEWESEFIEKNNIVLCRLYYPPFNFKRTGCKGCPYSLDLQEQLDIMDVYLPNEKKQCEILWKPVYDEYRRLGYRLRKQKERQMTIFEIVNEDANDN